MFLACCLVACASTEREAADSGGTVLHTKTYTCGSDGDCVMSCVTETGCCPNPCGCDTVRHKDEHATVQKQQIEHCSDKIEECPSVGACDPSFEYATPRCIEGTCVAKLPESRRTPSG